MLAKLQISEPAGSNILLFGALRIGTQFNALVRNLRDLLDRARGASLSFAWL